MKKKIFLIFVALILGIFVNFKIFEKKFYLNDMLSFSQIDFIKKILPFFFDKYIFNHNRTKEYYYMELEFKISNKNILVGKMKDLDLTNNQILTRFNLVNGFYLGMNNYFPGSGFLDFYENNLFVLSSRGVLGYTKNIEDDLHFKQIINNIDQFINLDQIIKNKSFSVKDLLIFNENIFVSYNEEIEEDCWNTSVLIGKINYAKINFKKLFSPGECVHLYKNKDKEFHPHPSGGRMVALDKNHIILTTGPYRERFLAQDKNSINGKLIKINIDNSNYEIISMGHRNPQGLYFDEENNFLIETEHGPQGGDEINIIEINVKNNDKIPNYGWAISSAGEHYGGKIPANEERYKKYPLYKSHSEHGFIEPLKSFVPSIGISEITRVSKNKYVVSSLQDRSLYFFELENRKVVSIERVEVFERVRDLKFKDNRLYLFLENTPSIGIIKLE